MILPRRHARGGRLERRQDLPPEAFFSATELRRPVDENRDARPGYEYAWAERALWTSAAAGAVGLVAAFLAGASPPEW